MLPLLALLFGLVCPLSAYGSESQTKQNLADGTYHIEVELEGGTGRASVSSPTLLTIQDGKAKAIIDWSSNKYDYMIVGGQRFVPIDQEGNSTFEIPVLAFDTPFEVIADTTAMSTPHEITYKLTFDTSTARKQSKAVTFFVNAFPYIIVIVIAATFFHVRRHP